MLGEETVLVHLDLGRDSADSGQSLSQHLVAKHKFQFTILEFGWLCSPHSLFYKVLGESSDFFLGP